MEKPELSKKSEYWIDKHRYYELKHFCLQYPLWKKEILEYEKTHTHLTAQDIIASGKKSPSSYRPVEEAVVRVMHIKSHINMIDRLTTKADPVIGFYLLKGVTEERPYESLRVMYNIPCNRAEYYEIYRKFFWMLSKERD